MSIRAKVDQGSREQVGLQTGRDGEGGGEREPSECLAHSSSSICAKKHVRVSTQAAPAARELSDGVAATSKQPSGRSVGMSHCMATRLSQKKRQPLKQKNRQMSCNQAAGENTFTPRVEQSATSSAREALNGYNGLVSAYCAIIECRQTDRQNPGYRDTLSQQAEHTVIHLPGASPLIPVMSQDRKLFQRHFFKHIFIVL